MNAAAAVNGMITFILIPHFKKLFTHLFSKKNKFLIRGKNIYQGKMWFCIPSPQFLKPIQ